MSSRRTEANIEVCCIDVGTTNVRGAVYNTMMGKPLMLLNPEGDSSTPTVLIYEEGEPVEMGRTAKNLLALKPGVRSPKSHIKERRATTEEGVSYEPQKAITDITEYFLSGAREVLDPEGEGSPGAKLEKVVVTYPAYYTESMKEDWKQAFEEAGLQVAAMLSEPAAAGLYYSEYVNLTEKKNQEMTLQVCDIGGGTTDFAVLHISEKKIDVLAYDGVLFGGDDLDSMIVGEYMKQLHAAGVFLKDSDTQDLQCLRLEAEKAKIRLSSPAIDKDSFVFFANSCSKYVELTLTREVYEGIYASMFENLKNAADRFAGICQEKGIYHVDTTLLVGGTCQIPYLKERFEKEVFAGSKTVPFKCTDVVALGGALYGYLTFEEGKQIQLGNSAAETKGPKLQMRVKDTIGVEVVNAQDKKDMYVRNLIFKDAPLPVTATRDVYTHYEHQKIARVSVCTSAAANPTSSTEESFLVGELRLAITEDLPVGSRITVSMEITETGLLKVTAVEPQGGTRVSARFQTAAYQ